MYYVTTLPEFCVLSAVFPQTECIIPQKKEAEAEKSAKPKKKRKVSLATPAGAEGKLINCLDSC